MKAPALAVFLLLSSAACSKDRGEAAAEGGRPQAVRMEATQVRDVRRQVDEVPTVVRTAAPMADGQQQLDRAGSLSSRNLLSRSDLETAQTRFDTATAAHDQALASARQLRADIEAQSSSLRPAQHELRDAVVCAPFAGCVAELLVARSIRAATGLGDANCPAATTVSENVEVPAMSSRVTRS